MIVASKAATATAIAAGVIVNKTLAATLCVLYGYLTPFEFLPRAPTCASRHKKEEASLDRGTIFLSRGETTRDARVLP